MKADRNLARYVQPPLSSSRLNRQWSAVAERTKGGFVGQRYWPALGLGLAAVCVIALVVTMHPFRSKAVAFEGAVLETAGSSSQLLTLVDGSRVELAEATRLEFSTIRPDAVRLLLTRGVVDLDVAHVEGRTFTVAAAGVDVTVRGTRFKVALSESPAAELTVSVQRGRVEASRRGSGEPSRLIAAGETWSTAVLLPGREETAASSAQGSDGAGPSPLVDESAAPPDAPPAPVESGALAEAGNRFSELVKARKFGDAYAALGPHGFARELERADAKRLLELADAARFSGHVREAVTPLDRLRRKFRSDPRAALAAFELGRLRMDSLGDPSGASEAFADAIALAPSGPVREDAQARQVQALERLGDTARCAQARDAYLARFPNGIHASSIRGRCGVK
jgi:transmembrane sensor